MVDIKLGKYGIKTADRLNLVLYVEGTISKPGSKNFGSVSTKILGYYSNLEQALNAYVNTVIADEEYTVKDIPGIFALLELIRLQIADVAKGVKPNE